MDSYGVTIHSLTVPAMEVFTRYFARMADALKECPEVVASDLYSSHLIARETVDKMLMPCFTPHHKATTLLMAVQSKIDECKSDKALKKLCGILAKYPNTRKLSHLIIKRYGELYAHEPLGLGSFYAIGILKDTICMEKKFGGFGTQPFQVREIFVMKYHFVSNTFILFEATISQVEIEDIVVSFPFITVEAR